MRYESAKTARGNVGVSCTSQQAADDQAAQMDLHAVLGQAGILVGIADFRPTFGRFGITSFEVLA